MKLIRVTGATVAVLFLAACGATSRHVSASQRAADQAAEEKEDAQEQARSARQDVEKAQLQAQEAARAEREAQWNAQTAAQREAQAEAQAAREAQAGHPGATERQATSDAKLAPMKADVLFAANSAELSADAKTRLDDLVKAWDAHAQAHHVAVQGYTDDSGSESANVQLSRQRAEAVAHYLESKGVPSARITTNALGSRNPARRDDTQVGRALNRRVEVAILPDASR